MYTVMKCPLHVCTGVHCDVPMHASLPLLCNAFPFICLVPYCRN